MEAKSERKKELPKELPESGSEFWGDGEQHSGVVEEIKAGPKHEWRQRGNVATCQICPIEHGVFLDDDHEVREGQIVKKRP